MTREPISSLEAQFADLTDPRGPNIEHLFFDIIAIAILGTICGADGWVEIEQFGHQKLGWLSQYLLLPNGIPSHDTFGRVFSQIDPEEFQKAVELYYEISGWDKDGKPTAGKLIDLNLEWLIEENGDTGTGETVSSSA